MTHVTPLDPPLGLINFWQDLAWSAEPDRGGKGSVKECRARLGRPWQIMTGPDMDWRCTGQGKAGLGRTWLGREGLVSVCRTEPREPRQAQASAKDRSAPGVCGILRYKMPVPPYPVLPGFARSCPNLPRPIRTQFALSWPSPILTGSVLSNTALPAAPVQFC